MAFRIVWAKTALSEARSLIRYIARDDAETARRFGNRLVSKVEKAAEFPRTGRMVPEFHDDKLREIIADPYRVVYEIDDNLNTLTVLRVWHGARGDIALDQ